LSSEMTNFQKAALFEQARFFFHEMCTDITMHMNLLEHLVMIEASKRGTVINILKILFPKTSPRRNDICIQSHLSDRLTFRKYHSSSEIKSTSPEERTNPSLLRKCIELTPLLATLSKMELHKLLTFVQTLHKEGVPNMDLQKRVLENLPGDTKY
jgi:hypothetical protein